MTPLLYNLFPLLAGPTTRWAPHAKRAREMGFDWLYLNPWHYPGFSGSLYAPKEFRRLNPHFLPPGADPADLGPLRTVLGEIRALGLKPVMDLVVNHTSKDSPLIDEHPGWYQRDEQGQVRSPSVQEAHDPSQVTVWGDLAEIDNLTSHDRDGLWQYWTEMVEHALELGFQGFRCDAAYKVPAALWRHLIDAARRTDPGATFFAETLGAPIEDVLALHEAGFDFFFNSSKWWDFSESWALEQHEKFGAIAPSIAFPETHDTDRLAAESGGREAVQRQRYAFAAAFSAGLMMPAGYEFGFRKRVDVVHTRPSDWERKHFDLRAFITRVNDLKCRQPLLQSEGHLRAAQGLASPVLSLERTVEGVAGTAWVLVNKDWDQPQPADELLLPARGGSHRLFRICLDDAPAAGSEVPDRLTLQPAEVAYLLPASS